MPLFTWTVTHGLQHAGGENSDGFSGAEIEQAITAGLYRALHDKKPMTDASLCEELHGTQPLSVARREDVERLRDTARGRFVPA